MDSPKRSSPQQEEDTLSSLFQNSSISNSSSAPGNSSQSSTPPSSDGEKLPLTIGIEMECLFVYNRKAALADFGPAPERGDVDGYLNETPGEPSPIRMVIQALSRVNVNVYLAPEEEAKRGPVPSYSRWTVDQDDSIESDSFGNSDAYPSNEEYGYFGLEIISPILSFNGEQWQEDVRLYVPDTTCGLHVHVGIGSKESPQVFPLPTVKSFLQLVTGFERVIDELHATCRFDCQASFSKPPSRFYLESNPDAKANFEDWGVSNPDAVNPGSNGKEGFVADTCSQGAGDWTVAGIETQEFGESVVDWCGYMENKVNSYQDLKSEGYMKDRFQAYNLQNFLGFAQSSDEAYKDPKETLELRQHRGTLSADEIVAWVDVAASMVKFAHLKDGAGAMMAVVERHAYDPAMGFKCFLRMIGASQQTVEHYHSWLDVDPEARGREAEQSERPSFRTAQLTRFFALNRESYKNPAEVFKAIKSRLYHGEYAVPQDEKEKLLEAKYKDFGLQNSHLWA